MVIFYLASFPQFIHPTRESQAAQPRLEGLASLGLAAWAAVTGTRSGH